MALENDVYFDKRKGKEIKRNTANNSLSSDCFAGTKPGCSET